MSTMGSEETPCTQCGHPGPFAPKNIPSPDPRKGMTILCAACKKDITYDTHQWKDGASGRWVCCGCMVTTRSLRDGALGVVRKPPFIIARRKVLHDGVRLILRHDGCEVETTITVKDSDDLTGRTPVECSCGFSIKMFCSDPKLMRELVKLLKRPNPSDKFEAASDASQN